MDIRLKTGLIIRRGREFLVGRILYSTEYRWSDSPWEAWRTRKKEEAEKIARRTGGEIWLFNPVAGQIRKANVE